MRLPPIRMASPPPPSPLSPGLLAADCAVISAYSISGAITSLFTNQEYLNPPVVAAQDLVDIAYTFNSAAALAAGWAVAAAVTGASRIDWSFLDHSESPIGLAKVLPCWLLSWPVGVTLKALAALEFAQWSSQTFVSLEGLVDMQTAAADGAGVLLTVALWRTWLLWWANQY